MTDLTTLSDADISLTFAVEVVGDVFPGFQQRGDKRNGIVGRWQGRTTKAPGMQPRTPEALKWSDGQYGGVFWPSYATSLDAVFPHVIAYLECSPFVRRVDFLNALQIQAEADGTFSETLLALHRKGLARQLCITLITIARADMENERAEHRSREVRHADT